VLAGGVLEELIDLRGDLEVLLPAAGQRPDPA
jgi:hypothetical protein